MMGFANPTPKFQTATGPVQNGSTLLDSHIGPRDIMFGFVLTAANLEGLQTLVANLASKFNPLNGPGTLTYTYENGTEYSIACIGNNTPQMDPMNKSLTHWAGTISLVAHNPFWSTTETLYPIVVGASSWIPWFANNWIIAGFGGLGSVINLGTQPISVKIDLYGGTGSVTNPTITLSGTGEFIAVTKKIDTGEHFSINTDQNVLTATSYDSGGVASNGYPYLTTTSTFFQLLAGTNTITLTASNADVGAYVSITKADKYVGV